jgi:HD superfamily phosphodiesterase
MKIGRVLMMCVAVMVETGAFRVGIFDSLYESYALVRCLSSKGKIDDSHNHLHAKEVFFWANILARKEKVRDEQELLMIGRCALLHDMMDHKYTDFSEQVREHLECFHSIDDVDYMMDRMNAMSYHKIVRPDGFIVMPYADTDRVFHIVREADLLSSFNLARMIEFRLSNKDMSDDEIRRDVKDVYSWRMATLCEKGLFTTRTGHRIAYSLDMICKLRLSLINHLDLHGDLDILRIVNYLSINSLVSELEQIPEMSCS